jgi:hypothetical protein
MITNTFKFLNDKSNVERYIKYISYTNYINKKRVAIYRFTPQIISYHESKEFWGSFNRFWNNTSENSILIEYILVLKKRKKWDGKDKYRIDYTTNQNDLSRIGKNDLIRVRYKEI